MYCKNCGNQIADEAVLCPQCGVSAAGKTGVPATEHVPNHMVWAVLSTICCCLIGGIISIVYASKVNARLARGDIDGAWAASRTAKLWIIVNVIVASVVALIPAIGILMGALFPAVSGAAEAVSSSEMAMRGRLLFTGITQACVEREAVGLQGVWPNTAGSDSLSDDQDDISGIPFRNSADYFRTLFDTASMGKEEWKPYVQVNASKLLISKDSDFCDWIVAANVKAEFDDAIPVLVSANVDPSVLKTSFNGHDDTPIPFGSKVGRTKLPWCDRFVIVIRKNGVMQTFRRRDFTYSNLYNNRSFSAPGLKYLDVE